MFGAGSGLQHAAFLVKADSLFSKTSGSKGPKSKWKF